MTTLDERYPDLPDSGDEPGFAQLVAELDTLGEGSPSPRADMMIRHALAVHARELAEQGRSRSTPVEVARRQRRVPFGWRRLQARLGVALAASVVLLGMGAYLHGQSPTPVSAQTVLHRAATASPGPNEAAHATYRVTSSDGSAGTADVWIGFDGSGAATQLALNLTMSQKGHSPSNLNANMVEVGQNLLQVYNSADGPAQVPAPARPVLSTAPGTISADPPAVALKGMVVGTLLAQKLSKQPNAYTLQQESLDGVPVYALHPAEDKGVTYYFNAQTYVLAGADWTQDGTSWRARLASYSTVPLSSVPSGTFGSAGPGAGQSGYKQGVTVSRTAPVTKP